MSEACLEDKLRDDHLKSDPIDEKDRQTDIAKLPHSLSRFVSFFSQMGHANTHTISAGVYLRALALTSFR